MKHVTFDFKDKVIRVVVIIAGYVHACAHFMLSVIMYLCPQRIHVFTIKSGVEECVYKNGPDQMFLKRLYSLSHSAMKHNISLAWFSSADEIVKTTFIDAGLC